MNDSTLVSDRRSTPNDSARIGGVALIFLASLLWSLNGGLIKWVNRSGEGPDGVTIAFYRSLFAGLLLLPLARGRYCSLRRASLAGTAPTASPPIRGAVILCVLCFALMTTCFVVANTKTEAANAILLQYTSTFWVFGLSPWVLGEKAAARDFAILLLAVAGIAVIFAGNADSDLAGLTIALGAGAAYGLLTLLLRLVRDCDPAAITVANNLGTALLLFPAVAVFGDLRVSFGALLLLMFMGVVQFGLPYYFFSLGLRRVPASQAALLTLTEPILVPVWAYLVVREPVPFTTLMGGGMILLALGVFLVVSRRPNTGASRMPTIDIRPAPPDNEPGNRSHAP